MAGNIYVTCTCGLCITKGIWCDGCKKATLNANGGRLPQKWEDGKRKALEEFIGSTESTASKEGKG
jgi:hypothetical protein